MCFCSLGSQALHCVVSVHNLGHIHYENNTLLQWQKWCWPLPNRIRANRVSLFKDNSRATFLVRQMMLLACRVPASLFSGCRTGDDSFLICFRETWVTGFCFSCCNKAFPVVGENRVKISFCLHEHLPEVYSAQHGKRGGGERRRKRGETADQPPQRSLLHSPGKLHHILIRTPCI